MKRQFISMPVFKNEDGKPRPLNPSANGEASAELFGQFVYEWEGREAVLLVTQLPKFPIAVTENRTRFRVCTVEPHQINAAKGDVVEAAKEAFTQVINRYGAIKFFSVLDNTATYEEPEL